MNRRGFLRLVAGIGGVALVPRLSVASTLGPSSGKNLVVINLFGGCDGLAMLPYYSGVQASRIATYRPSINVGPGAALDLGGQNGLPYRIGMHPGLASVASNAAGRIAVVQRYGLINESGRSHDTSQLLVSLGADSTEYDAGRGFLARLMDNQQWESLQYWGLSGDLLADFNSREQRPIVVSRISEFGLASLYPESDLDARQVAETFRELQGAGAAAPGIAIRYSETLSRVHDSIGIVQREIASQQIAQFGDGIGESLADATRILAAKKGSVALGQRDKSTVIYCGMGGYDTHSDQGIPTALDDGLGWNLKNLGDNLGIFISELKRIGVWEDTVVVVISEFGRTVRQNGSSGTEVGTDHGWGNNTFVVGGAVNHGVYGEPPSLSELDNEDENALVASIDYRDIFSDVFRWMGVPSTGVFPAGYSATRLGML